MKKKLTQFRYYGDDNEKNYPGTIDSSKLESGMAFEGKTPIVQLGIQTLPGIRFYVNANIDGSVIGASGIYEVDLTNSTGKITKLTFDPASIKTINSCWDGYLVVDIMYEEE